MKTEYDSKSASLRRQSHGSHGTWLIFLLLEFTGVNLDQSSATQSTSLQVVVFHWIYSHCACFQHPIMWFKGRVTKSGEHCLPSLLFQELHPPHLPRCITSNMISGWNPPSLFTQTTRSTTRISCESVSVCVKQADITSLCGRHSPQRHPEAVSLSLLKRVVFWFESRTYWYHIQTLWCSHSKPCTHTQLYPAWAQMSCSWSRAVYLNQRFFQRTHNVQFMDVRSRIWQKVHWMTLAPL